MSIEENLTYLQKTAIKGEIAFALSTASHNSEMKYRTYLILKEVEDKYKPFIIECIKDAVTFDETIIDRIYLEVVNNTVPVWLWTEEVISDIKLHLIMADAGLAGISGNRLSINKVQERKNIIESAFIMFVRESLLLSPNATEQLLNEIIDDYDLEFLHGACFYLKSNVPEMREIRKKNAEEVPEEIMSCLFDIKKMMSFAVESKALNMLNKAEKKEGRYRKITKQPLPTKDEEPVVPEVATVNFDTLTSLNSDATITHEELSQYISDKIAELFEGVSDHKPVHPPVKHLNTVYVVKKIYTESGLSTNIRVCNSEEEAEDFIKKIVREYPELTRTCEFQVERVNEKEKKKHRET